MHASRVRRVDLSSLTSEQNQHTLNTHLALHSHSVFLLHVYATCSCYFSDLKYHLFVETFLKFIQIIFDCLRLSWMIPQTSPTAHGVWRFISSPFITLAPACNWLPFAVWCKSGRKTFKHVSSSGVVNSSSLKVCRDITKNKQKLFAHWLMRYLTCV